MTTIALFHSSHFQLGLGMSNSLHTVVEEVGAFADDVVHVLGAIIGVVVLWAVVVTLPLGLAMVASQLVDFNEHPVFVDNTPYPVYSNDGMRLLSLEEMNGLLALRK